MHRRLNGGVGWSNTRGRQKRRGGGCGAIVGGGGTVNSGGCLQSLRIALHTISISISLQNSLS